MTQRIDVRLRPDEHALVSTLAAALRTPLMPTVTAADVLRAGLVALQDRLLPGTPEARQ